MKSRPFFIIGTALVFFLFSAFVPQASDQRSNRKFVVVLDAGHGGHDPGNLGNGYLEKNIALGIVLAAGKALESETDIEVVYTRKDDRFVDLYVRGEIANKAKADLFVSIHCDSHSSDASGAGTFVLGLHANKQNFEIAKKENSVIYLEDNYETRYAAYDINSPESIIGLTIMQEEFLDQSILLGKMMQDNFTQQLKRKDRKVKQAGFIVLHQTFMPSVLIETGFLTNKDEGAWLNSSNGQGQMGKAIADAIVNYKENLWAGSTAFDEPGENVITAVPEVKTEEAPEIPEQAAAEETEDIAKETVAETTEIAEEKKQEVSSAVIETKTDKADLPATEAGAVVAVAATEKELKTAQIPEETTVEVAEEKSVPKEPEITKEPETKPVPAAEPKSQPASEKPEAAAITFKVQILASSKVIPLRAENFNGLSTISKEPYKNLFRYMYGSTNSYDQAKLLKSNADLKGYTTSFIVAYKDGKRIPVKEAIKTASQ